MHSRDTLPMTVKNMGFLIDRMGADCAPLQFIRELTQNSIEGILNSPERQGEIHWDVDWATFDLTQGRAQKLCIIDNGVGMTGEEMVEYINQLSSSIHEQSSGGNYGVGAKIAAAPKNKAGLVYLSWKDGVGYQIWLWKDPTTNEYGLKKFERPDGTTDYWSIVDNGLKPDLIENNGTMVMLMGNSELENTIESPPNAPMPSRWILRYLNSRYYSIPDGIRIMAREGWTNPLSDSRHNFLRQVIGMQSWLAGISQASGKLKLNGADALWWILKGELDTDAGHYSPGGHVAVLYHNELYELLSGRSGGARLQEFGIIFGYHRIVLYLEPRNYGTELTSNTARTHLLLNGDSLPWSDWAAEFRENMPEPIAKLMEEVGAAAANTDHSKSIKERLNAIRDLFKFSRYRATKAGSILVPESDLLPGGPGKEKTGGGPLREGAASTGENVAEGRGNNPGGNIYAMFQAEKGLPGKEVKNLLEPEVRWVSATNGTRENGEMEDRAAKYLPQSHTLLINSDFRIYEDMIERWSRQHKDVPGARIAV